jgi:hypothetical protein
MQPPSSDDPKCGIIALGHELGSMPVVAALAQWQRKEQTQTALAYSDAEHFSELRGRLFQRAKLTGEAISDGWTAP